MTNGALQGIEGTNDKINGGFEPIPGVVTACQDPHHAPPTMLYIPPGQQYRHICPTCKNEVVLRRPQVSFTISSK